MNQSSGGCTRPPVKKVSDRLTVTFLTINRMHCSLAAVALSATLMILFVPVAAYPQAEDPLAQYRVLEWKELVPESWEPPLVPESFDEIGISSVDETSVVAELDQQLAVLPGFMKPVVFEGNQVSEFLLVPFLPHHTRQHAHLDANQKVYVYLLEPVQVETPFAPLWVVGTITLDPVMTDEGPAAYRMFDAVTTVYEY